MNLAGLQGTASLEATEKPGQGVRCFKAASLRNQAHSVFWLASLCSVTWKHSVFGKCRIC